MTKAGAVAPAFAFYEKRVDSGSVSQKINEQSHTYSRGSYGGVWFG